MCPQPCPEIRILGGHSCLEYQFCAKSACWVAVWVWELAVGDIISMLSKMIWNIHNKPISIHVKPWFWNVNRLFKLKLNAVKRMFKWASSQLKRQHQQICWSSMIYHTSGVFKRPKALRDTSLLTSLIRTNFTTQLQENLCSWADVARCFTLRRSWLERYTLKLFRVNAEHFVTFFKCLQQMQRNLLLNFTSKYLLSRYATAEPL